MAPQAAKKLVELPWAERHRPRHLGQVVGNTDQVRKLAEWLRDWDDVVLKGKVKEQPAAKEEWRTYKPVQENLNARAALISGPPGIGKTTTCTLVARCSPKYKLMEFNASDARGKSIIDSMSNSLAGNHTLKMGGAGKGCIERAVIIMDECDGMAGGGDKGGMQALINMIKATKNPIICICNDRGDQQVRNLSAHCFDIKFRRPENLAVARRVKAMLESEGRKVEASQIEAVVEACGQDIRQVVNHVQFFGSAQVSSNKDTQAALSPFDVCTKLLGGVVPGQGMPMGKRLDMFFVDADMVPLMIQENYLRCFEKRGDDDELSKCAQAAELIAIGDSMSGSWEVAGSAAVIGSIYPAAVVASKEPLVRPGFPSWLQKRSGMTKGKALAQELHSRLRAATTCSLRGLVTSGYHEVLHRTILRPLQMGSPKDCAQALLGYGLSREFFTDQAPALRQPLQVEDPYKTKVDGKLKHQLLQELQALAQQPGPIKRKRAEEDGGGGGGKRRGRGGEDMGGADEADDAEKPGEEEDGGLVSARKGPRKAEKPKTKKKEDFSKCTLSGWVPKKEQALDEHGERPEKKPMLILKYLDGHTVAVRRKVRMNDFLGPWTMF